MAPTSSIASSGWSLARILWSLSRPTTVRSILRRARIVTGRARRPGLLALGLRPSLSERVLVLVLVPVPVRGHTPTHEDPDRRLAPRPRPCVRARRARARGAGALVRGGRAGQGRHARP